MTQEFEWKSQLKKLFGSDLEESNRKCEMYRQEKIRAKKERENLPEAQSRLITF